MAGYSSGPDASVRLEEAKRVLDDAIQGLKIQPGKANRIVVQEFKKTRMAMVNTINRKTGLSKAQTKRRVQLSRGRTYANTRIRWKFAQIKTGGKAQIIHAGRLKPRRAGRGKKAPVTVQGRTLEDAFFWNPPGKKLQRDNRRLYQRKEGRDIKAVRGRDLGKPTIKRIYETSGKRIALGVTRRITRRILNEAIRTLK